MPKLDEYLKISEAAEFLGVCNNTLRNWEENGTLPARRHPANGYRLYLKNDLERFLASISKASEQSNRRTSTTKPKPR